MSRGVPVIGLFSGAGGLDLGAALAGGNLRLSIDNDSIACQTLRSNPKYHSGKVVDHDVSGLTGHALRDLAGLNRTEPCIIIGGPPCQPFSKAAYWTDPGHDSRYRQARSRGEVVERPLPIEKPRADERRSLVQDYLRLVIEARAEGFLFENVPSITHPRNRNILEKLMEDAKAAGFGVTLLRVNAVEYGVPQARHRVVVLGLRKGALIPPEPTHAAALDRSKILLPPVTSGEALKGFNFAKYAEPEEVVKGRWAEQLREVPPGQNYKALTAWAGHPKPLFIAETRFWHFLLKLSPDLPSWTVPANPGPWVGPFHWDSRRLRTIELAALQSFPEGFTFAGNRRDRVRQIGNAVPPLLARKVIEPLIEAIASHQKPYRPKRKVFIACGA